jgi:acetyl-CoA decarbonylase/synthase complex subunit delta
MVIYTSNGALGYGFEYAYSIMERTCLATLGGDTLMAMPVIANAGSEVQRAKEAKAIEAEFPEWGSEVERGIAWETTTAVGYLQAGADILTMCTPKAIEVIKNYIDEMWKE